VIFTTSAKKLTQQYQGLKSGVVRTAVENDLTQVMQGKLNAQSGWTAAVADAKKAASG